MTASFINRTAIGCYYMTVCFNNMKYFLSSNFQFFNDIGTACAVNVAILFRTIFLCKVYLKQFLKTNLGRITQLKKILPSRVLVESYDFVTRVKSSHFITTDSSQSL